MKTSEREGGRITMESNFEYLIGVSGKARAGKDTVARYLRSRYLFHHTAFAAKLKDVVRDLFGLSDAQVSGSLKETVDERYGKSPRWLLQYVGTEAFRDIHKGIWVENLFRDIAKRDVPRVVISDVRFPNEVKAIREMGGHVWKVVRNGYEGAESGIKGHVSETSLDHVPDSDYGAVLSAGNGNLSLLHDQADQALAQISKKGGGL